MLMKIIVSAGGSGGHIYPALSIIEYFQKQEKNLEVLYIGTHNRMEKEIVPKKGIPYEKLEIYGFNKDIKRDIKNVFLIRKAKKKCLKIMKDFKPDVVIGVGGYVTYPVVWAAHQLGIKTFIHEQNSRPGKVNYLVSRYADVVGITFKSSESYFKKAKKVVYTGHPSLDTHVTEKLDIRTLGFSKDQPLVLYVAGSLGSSSLNQKMIDFLNGPREGYSIFYVVGSNVHLEDFKSQITNHKDLKIVDYFEDLPKIMSECEVVISRAGAGTLFEIIALGKKSIVIPSPNVANNHQYYNAKELEENNVITVLSEEKLSKEILNERIFSLLKDNYKTQELKKNMKRYQEKKPLEEIYNLVKDLTCSSKKR